jgi:hypothetical protein
MVMAARGHVMTGEQIWTGIAKWFDEATVKHFMVGAVGGAAAFLASAIKTWWFSPSLKIYISGKGTVIATDVTRAVIFGRIRIENSGRTLAKDVKIQAIFDNQTNNESETLYFGWSDNLGLTADIPPTSHVDADIWKCTKDDTILLAFNNERLIDSIGMKLKLIVATSTNSKMTTMNVLLKRTDVDPFYAPIVLLG